jgi:hypothetical protein
MTGMVRPYVLYILNCIEFGRVPVAIGVFLRNTGPTPLPVFCIDPLLGSKYDGLHFFGRYKLIFRVLHCIPQA